MLRVGPLVEVGSVSRSTLPLGLIPGRPADARTFRSCQRPPEDGMRSTDTRWQQQ